jgi:SAM-dependent methyltransferase
VARYYRYDGVAPRELLWVPCPVCGAANARELGVDNGFHVVKCREAACGFVYVNPRPSQQEVHKLYRCYYPQDPTSPDMWEREMAPIFDECRDALVAWLPRGTVLDIGCSYGHFLQRMAGAGWDTVGVEPSPGAARHARMLGGHVIEADFEDAPLASSSFDAVVALYVLEHVTDPRMVLGKVFEVLRPGGRAIIRVPHTEPLMPLNRLFRRPLLQAPMHLNDFSPRTLTRLARDVGFETVRAGIGRLRRSHDPLERAGALLFGGLARALELLTDGRLLCPYSGAKSYLLTK